MKKLAGLFLSVHPFPCNKRQETVLMLKEQTGLLIFEIQ